MTELIASYPRTKLIESTGSYYRYSFKTLIMRFVDDVELDFSKEGVIHFRSASRLGYSDMGANRKRMEKLRKDFNATMKP